MILRKPYAFLIKYFKIIHIILFLIFTYLVFEIRNIYMFFVNYVKAGNFTYLDNMANDYLNPLIFIMIILIIAFAISVYELMKKKEKPILFYKILIIYGFVLLIFWIYFRNFFATLGDTSYDALTIIIYRDIIAFLYYINYFYVGFSFIRGFGFDIKKFSFDKDKKELNLEETDNEEYELNIGVDKDNVANYIRRERREFKYYLKENKTFFVIASIVLIIGLGVFIYFNYFVENKVYVEKDQININNIIYRVNNCLLTDLDKHSNEISANKSFIVVNMDILNKNTEKKINKETFRIKMNNHYYYPVLNYNYSFNDLGVVYSDEMYFPNGKVTNVNLVFKIEREDIKEIYFELLKSNNSSYERINIKPVKQEQEVSTYKLNESVAVSDYNIKIASYKVYDKTSYEYDNCYNEVCNKLTKMVTPKLNDCILALEIENLKDLKQNFIENYVGLKYLYSDKVYSVSSKDIAIVGSNKDIIYLSVPNTVKKASRITVAIKTRSNEYDIEMGG